MTEVEKSPYDQLESIPDCDPTDYPRLCVEAHIRLSEDASPEVRAASRARIQDAFKLLVFMNISIGEIIVPKLDGLGQRRD